MTGLTLCKTKFHNHFSEYLLYVLRGQGIPEYNKRLISMEYYDHDAFWIGVDEDCSSCDLLFGDNQERTGLDKTMKYLTRNSHSWSVVSTTL
jgi:hypothetical protein